MRQDPPNAIPIHRSLLRPILVLGAEREPALLLAMVAAAFVFSVVKLWSALTGLLLWGLGIAALQRLARHDPKLTRVLARHLNSQRHYPAGSTPFVRAARWQGRGY